MKILQPPGWPRPKGYSNGILAEGQLIFIGGQIGWDETETIRSDDFVEQTHQTLVNIATVLKEADAKPEHIVRMTWYIKNKQEYLNSLSKVGQVYKDVMGSHYPAMAMVQVADLIEDKAKVEIESMAVIPK